MSLLTSAYLGALGIIAIPILLHFLNRKTPTLLKFPSIRFIGTSRLESLSRKSLNDILLLILRCIIISAIIIAFCSPFLPIFPKEQKQIQQSKNIIICDVSSSMNRKNALRAIQNSLKDLTGKEKKNYTVIFSSNEIVQESEAISSERLISYFSKIPFTNHEGNHIKALEKAVKILNNKPGNIFIISDFQLHDWRFTNWAETDNNIDYKFINPFQSEKFQNISIQSVKYKNLYNEEKVQIYITLKNHTENNSKTDLTVKIGNNINSQTINLKPYQQRKTLLTLDSSASNKAVVNLSQDDYLADNQYHFWIGKPAPLKVTIIGDFATANSANLTELFFLKNALEGVKSLQTPFEIKTQQADSKILFNRKKTDAVILLNAGLGISRENLTFIADYANNGGLVIITPSKKNPIKAINELKRAGLISLLFKGIKKMEDMPFKILDFKKESELLSIFKQSQNESPFRFSIFQFTKVKAAGTHVKKLMTIDDNSPFLLSVDKGKGNVFFFTVPFNHSWSDLPISQSFLPLIRQLCSLSSRQVYLEKLICGAKAPVDKDSMALFNTNKADSHNIQGQIYQVNVSPKESQTATINLIDLTATLKGKNIADPANQKQKNPDKKDLTLTFLFIALLAFFLEFLIS